MKTHHERKIVPYTPDKMYQLVADVKRYPEFLPWCDALRIKRRWHEEGEEKILTEMAVRFKMFRESFTSKAHLNTDDKTILVEYISGPFRDMKTNWAFQQIAENQTEILFTITFQFQQRVLQIAAAGVFEKASRHMATAFVERAHTLYGCKGQNV